MKINRSASRRLSAIAALGGVLALGLAACSSSVPPPSTTGSGNDGGAAGAAELTTLNVSTIGLNSDGALLLGMEKGFFAEEGLKIERSVVANPPAGLAAAQSGQVDITYSPSIPLLNGLSQGIPLKVLAPDNGFAPGAVTAPDPENYNDSALVASQKSGITSLKELAGKTIAVPARKAHLEVVIAYDLREAGVDLNSINWVSLDFVSAVAALNNGTIEAAGLVSPHSEKAIEEGNTFVSSPGIAFFEGGPVGMWVAGTTTIESKKDSMEAFQRAIKKSKEYANEHPEEAIRVALTANKSDLTVEQVKTPFWALVVTQSDLEKQMDKLVSLGFLEKTFNLDGVVWDGK